MVTVQDLINDEKEAIAGYKEFLRQGIHKGQVTKIRRIIADEERHIRILQSLKT